MCETKPVDGERRYWLGRTTNNAYWLILEEPINIFAVGTWFAHHQEMIDAHDGGIDRFVEQFELPF